MLGIVLDRALSRSLGSQLSDQLRARIVSGHLEGLSRLPSSRELAHDLGISRTLVLEAFEQLEAEGYIEGIRGRGSFVRAGSACAPDWNLEPGREVPAAKRPLPPRAQPETPAPEASGALFPGQSPGPTMGRRRPVDFKPGVPALDQFPRETWARALAEAARTLPKRALGYGDGAGLWSLREETAAYLFRAKGVRAEPEDIFITSGCSQALGLISRALLRRGGRAVLENPCQPALSGLLRREGVELVAASVDAEGMETASLPRDRNAVAFVTPSHQYPLGSVLSAPRRAALVEWARATDSIIVEDDFDGEFRYGGPPLLPLRESDPARVVYAGSFSKSFSPALRLGYAIVPPRLREAWRSYRELMDIHSCVFTQAAMASTLETGGFERHVRRMRKLYAGRRSALIAGIERRFGDGGVEVMGEAAGLHLALRFRPSAFPGLDFDESLVSRIASDGALVYPASRFAFETLPGIERALLLGYGNLSEEEMERGLSALEASIRARPGYRTIHRDG